MTEISELQDIIRRFIVDRDWNKFHSLPNLAKAISCESAELLENFIWEDNPDKTGSKQRYEEEIADIFIYILRFCDVADIDIIQATKNKIALNNIKYPVEKAKGNAKKYTEF